MSPRLVFRTDCWSAMDASRVASLVRPRSSHGGPHSDVQRGVRPAPRVVRVTRGAGVRHRPVGYEVDRGGIGRRDEGKGPMQIRRKKTILAQATDYVEAAVEKAGPLLADAKDKAVEALADAKDQAAPALADA